MRSDGSIRWVRVTTGAALDKRNQILKIVGHCEEITARKQAEIELMKAKTDQEAIVQERTSELHDANLSLRKEVVERLKAEGIAHQESLAKSIFLANMSHEIVIASLHSPLLLFFFFFFWL